MPKSTQEKIIYGFQDTPLGEMIVAKSGSKSNEGLCWIGFMTTRVQGSYKGDAFERMKVFLPEAEFVHDDQAVKADVDAVISAWETDDLSALKLDLRGTEFQKSVWQSLLKIPKGKLVSYGEVANDIDRPKAYRAVGTAVGENPLTLIVPCHRVVQASGALGNYGWGLQVKERLLELEGAV